MLLLLLLLPGPSVSVDRRRPPRVRPQSTRTASTASMTTVCIASKSEVVPHQRENKTKVETHISDSLATKYTSSTYTHNTFKFNFEEDK